MDPQLVVDIASRCKVVALKAGGVGATGDVKESYDGCQLRAIPLADWGTPKASMDNYNNNGLHLQRGTPHRLFQDACRMFLSHQILKISYFQNIFLEHVASSSIRAIMNYCSA